MEPTAAPPLWSALPFAGVLLSIALLPLLAPHFWHRRYPAVAAGWALLLAGPLLWLQRGEGLQLLLEIAVLDYVPFIVLIWSLFTIAGGIHLRGAWRGTPGGNVALLGTGTLLASLIGTTGASMVMIRPLLRANAGRRHAAHVVVFFIFLVANIGGSLTPLGDPPLFLGFLHGVPFFWVAQHLATMTALATALLLLAFWLIDRRLRARDVSAGPAEPGGLRVEGAANLWLLLGVLGAVLFSGTAKLGEVPLVGHVAVARAAMVRDGALLALGWLSLRFTPRAVRERNEFSWGPLREVAILFAAIFVTIVPALQILRAGEHGPLAALFRSLRDPAHYFWATGGLSSFLDNAPTYLAFLHAALGGAGATPAQIPGLLGAAGEGAADPAFARDLVAISAGAVFMGANSYIGNAPNFMVRSIAEESGVRMPGFFGYILRWTVPVLLPVFALVTWLFFR